MEFTKRCARSALSAGLFALLAGCKSAPAPERDSPSPKIALQSHTEPVDSAANEDCGLAHYPASRSNQEILADAPLNSKEPPNSDMLAKIAVDKDGKITHLRVLRLAHSNAPNWKEINNSALNDIRRWHLKPSMYQSKPVAVCSDVSVTVDLH